MHMRDDIITVSSTTGNETFVSSSSCALADFLSRLASFFMCLSDLASASKKSFDIVGD